MMKRFTYQVSVHKLFKLFLQALTLCMKYVIELVVKKANSTDNYAAM